MDDTQMRREGQTSDSQAEEAEMMQRLQEEIRNLPVGDHLIYMMHSLSALAIGRMGLTPDTAARRELDQARLAVDAFKALLEIVERVRPAQEMAAHRQTLSQLQLAYVGVLDGGPSEESGAAGSDVGSPADAAGADVPTESDELAAEAGASSE